MTKSVKLIVGGSMHGNGTSQCALFHLQSVSAPANRIVQHTNLVSSLFAGAVLALWCLVLFNDCVQPCFTPRTIKPESIVDPLTKTLLHLQPNLWRGLYASALYLLFYFYVCMSWGPIGGQQTEYNT